MAKPATSVVFQPDAPLGVLSHKLKTIDVDGEQVLYLNCSEVRDTTYGFLHLLPLPDPGMPVFGLFVPAHYVMYMVQHERPEQMGFV